MSSGISSKPEQAGHGAPFLSFQTVFHNHFIPKELTDLMSSTEKEQETHSICKGDIFLTRTSEVIDELGMSCVALEDYPKATFSGFLKRFRPIKDNIAYEKYMGFYLRSQLFRKSMTNNATMTLRASLNKEIVSYLDLYLPEYATQKTIGDFLFLLNSKIECNNRINAELEVMAKTLYNYWFLQFDFPNENGMPYKSSGGKMVYNSTLKKEIPYGWNVLSLCTIASCIQRGISPSYADRSSIVVLNQKCIRDHKLDFSKARFHDAHRKSVPAERFIQNGDILVNSTGVGTLGRLTQVWGSPTRITIDSHITLIRPNVTLVSHAFLGYSMIHREKEIESLGEGSTGQTELSRNTLGALDILCPDNSIQQNFSIIVRPNLELIHKNIQENQKLSQLRDWLLPMLMNGQVTVQ